MGRNMEMRFKLAQEMVGAECRLARQLLKAQRVHVVIMHIVAYPVETGMAGKDLFTAMAGIRAERFNQLE